FPGGETPFYRATNFAKYSPRNVPDADVGRYRSYLTETAYVGPRDGDVRDLESRVVAGLHAVGLLDHDASIASVHTIDVDYAYPVPTRERDSALRTIQPWLMARDVFSRGRFGS